MLTIRFDGLSASRGLRIGRSTGEHRPSYGQVARPDLRVTRYISIIRSLIE
jgi:hypothetical protein